MKKISTALILTLLLAICCPGPGALAASYSDTSGHWAEAAIETYSAYEIIKGSDGSFRPDDSISRAEMAVILDRLLNYTEKTENTFKDLSDGAWYTESMLRLNKAGIILGDGEYIRPSDKMTRQEAAVLIARAFSLKSTGGSVSYADSGEIASWALDSVASMTQAGYLSGYDGSFNPSLPMTRAQVVTMLDNIIERIYDYGGIVTRSGLLLYGDTWYDIYDNLAVNTYADRGTFSSSGGVTGYASGGVSARLGIDVSFWQGEIDWAKTAASGIEFAMIRLGYRASVSGEIFLDTQFLNNIRGALDNGIEVGVYFFSQAINEEEAREEARYVLDNLSGWDITYPVVYDWEPVSGDDVKTANMSNSMLNRCAAAFCDTVEDAGYTSMVYTNKWCGMTRFDLGQLSGYDLWFAGYTAYPTLYYEMQMWQFTSSGSVAGIEGNVDMNLCFVDYPSGTPLFR